MNKSTRKTIIAGNWKMNNTASESTKMIQELISLIPSTPSCDIILCVPFTDIPASVNAAANSNIKIGAQNVHFKPNGAYTGEISASMLCEAGVSYVIVGHSERREYFAETDKTVNLRTQAALNANLKVILCVGELLSDRQSNLTQKIVSTQIELDLANISASQMENVIIAYEPVWAIGTGTTATPEQADKACAYIRDAIKSLYNDTVAQATTIQYGGSMNDENAQELLSKVNVDGGLIGGASLIPSKFAAIIKAAQ